MQSTLIKGNLSGLLAVAVLASCATTPHLDAKFGDAVNTAKAQQTLNPDASRNASPAVGLDGKAANAIIGRYHKAHEAPSPAPSGAIGIITGAGTTLK